MVELVIPLEVMGDKFETLYPSDEFDVVAWKDFFATHQKFKTICLNCLANTKMDHRVPLGAGTATTAILDDADDAAKLGFGFVALHAASRAIMMKWYRLGQDRVFGKTGKRRALANMSDDEDDVLRRGAPWANQPVHLNAASTALALRWMVHARIAIQDRGQHMIQSRQDRRSLFGMDAVRGDAKPRRKKGKPAGAPLEKGKVRRK
jgi:hypothetical protein